MSGAGLHNGWQIAIALTHSASSGAEVCAADLVDMTLADGPWGYKKDVMQWSFFPFLSLCFKNKQTLKLLTTTSCPYHWTINSSTVTWNAAACWFWSGHIFYGALLPKRLGSHVRPCEGVYHLWRPAMTSLMSIASGRGTIDRSTLGSAGCVCASVCAYVCSGGTMLQIKGKMNL